MVATCAAVAALSAAALAAECAEHASTAAEDAEFEHLLFSSPSHSGSDTDLWASDSEPDFESNPPSRKHMRDQLESGRMRIDSGYEMELLLSQKLKRLKL